MRESQERLDAYWREYAAQVLRAAGFRKRRRVYRLDGPQDGYAFVTAHGYPGGFRIGVGVAVAPITRLLAWWGDRVDIIGDAAWATRLDQAPPGQAYAGDWSVVDTQPERDETGARLASYVREQAIPLLIRLLDHDELLEEIRHRHIWRMTPMGEYALELALLAERGPNAQLEALLARPPANAFEQRAQTYARERLSTPPPAL